MPKRGVNITFYATSAKIQTPGRTFLANMHRGLYILNLWSNQPRDKTAHASYSITDPTLLLWHERMGHLGEQNVKRLQDMSTGMTGPVKATPCTECLLGRMKEKPHNTPSRRGEYPLEYIHTDIAGPFPIAGYNGCRYWVTFLDDATQLSTVIPITTKSKMFGELRKFLSMYERPERRCHRIRLDDSGENRSHEFRQWCAQRGIAVEVTTTEKHQQNGAAEALNRVIMDKLHHTLLSAHLDKKWWPEILLTVNYLRNLSPSSVIGKTPYEAWYGEKPDISRIRTIGCTAYTMRRSEDLPL